MNEVLLERKIRNFLSKQADNVPNILEIEYFCRGGNVGKEWQTLFEELALHKISIESLNNEIVNFKNDLNLSNNEYKLLLDSLKIRYLEWVEVLRLFFFKNDYYPEEFGAFAWGYTMEKDGFQMDPKVLGLFYEISCIVNFLDYEIEDLKKTDGQLSENPINNISSHLHWENKTDLAELIHVLFKSNSIMTKGHPIQKKDLTKVFINLFNISDLNVDDLINKGCKTFKRGDHKNSFISKLNTEMNIYIEKINIKQKE